MNAETALELSFSSCIMLCCFLVMLAPHSSNNKTQYHNYYKSFLLPRSNQIIVLMSISQLSSRSVHKQWVAMPSFNMEWWNTKICSQSWKAESWNGTGMCHDPADLPRPSCRAPYQEGEREADRGRHGKTISKSGQAWPSPTHSELQRTETDGGGSSGSHQWCLNNPTPGVRRSKSNRNRSMKHQHGG